MKRILFFIFFPVLFFTIRCVHAQLPYKLSVLNQPYMPIPDAANLVSDVWFNSDYYILPIPFGFKIDTLDCNAPYIAGGSTIVTDSGKTTVSSFFLTDANLIDKGFLGSDISFLSPIRCKTEGTAGTRIFKLEIANAAFFNELVYGTQVDSVYMQLWLYETSNIVELRYGPSHISHAYNYFPNKGFPCVGYIQDVDSNLTGNYYILGGNPDSPFVETIHAINGILATKPSGLNSFPSEGTVYRFTPRKLGIDEQINKAVTITRVYPTTCQNEIKIDYATDKPGYASSYTFYSVNGIATTTGRLLPNATTTVDISNAKAGIYILQLQTSEGVKIEKIIKL